MHSQCKLTIALTHYVHIYMYMYLKISLFVWRVGGEQVCSERLLVPETQRQTHPEMTERSQPVDVDTRIHVHALHARTYVCIHKRFQL